MKSIVAYIRVSTTSQGRSGLGIESQREALTRFAKEVGFDIVAEFVEIETGKGSDALDRRPQLAAALATARAMRCRSWSPSSIASRATCISFPV